MLTIICMITSSQCATIRMNLCGGITQLFTYKICRHDPGGPMGDMLCVIIDLFPVARYSFGKPR